MINVIAASATTTLNNIKKKQQKKAKEEAKDMDKANTKTKKSGDTNE